jgi:hypothetical protein
LKLRRLAREPLVQFLALSAAIFLLAGWLGRRSEQRIVVTNGQIDRMIWAKRRLYESLRKQYTVTVEAWRAPETPAAGSRP